MNHRNSPIYCAGQDKPLDVSVVMDAYLKAVAYARRKLARFEQSGLGAFVTPEDVAHTALIKTLDGTRLWNSKEVPDLFIHLAGCIKGEISTIYRSAENRLINREQSSEELENVGNIQEEVKTEEELAEIKKFVKAILFYIKENRVDLLATITYMYDKEVYKPQKIAEGLKISVKQVNADKLAIKRIANSNRFLANYIATNHHHLEQIATVILNDKLKKSKEIAHHLGITESEAISQRDELFFILNNIKKSMV